MMRRPFAFLLLLLAPLALKAQESSRTSLLPILPGLSATDIAGNRAYNEPHKRVFYIASDGKVSEEAQANSQKIEVSFRDSVSGTVRQYSSSGKLRHLIAFAHIPLRIKHGVEMRFSESGAVLTRQEFQAGKQHGEFLAYFPDGKIERRIMFDNDRYLSIDCFGRNGQIKNCHTEESDPVYPGGSETFSSDLQKGIIYPALDLKDERGGRLQLNIDLDSTGAVGETRMMGNGTPEMRQAVLQGVQQLRKFRKPGIQEKRPIAVTLLVQVGFAVKKAGKGQIEVSSVHCVFPPFSEQR